jgi:hypothetical protein
MTEQQKAALAAAKNPRSKQKKCTPEELAAIARANGARSRGATSPEGAARARRGNYKHGLSCEILPLETEDGGAIAETVRGWYGYYRPNSPAAHTLVKMLAHSDIMLDRCYAFLGTALGTQGKEVIGAWEEGRQTLLACCVGLFPTAPDQAIIKLKTFGHGCRWLLDAWTRHQDGLLRYGYWPLEIVPDLVRLHGANPDVDQIGASPDAYMMALFSYQCQPRPAVERIAELCAPHRRPVTLAHLPLPAALPGPEECRQQLRTMVAETIEELQSLELTLRMGNDREDLERVLKLALVLNDDGSSRQFLRYHREWGARFFRAYGILPQTLARDAAGFFDDLAASDEEDDEPPPDAPRPNDPEPGSVMPSESDPAPTANATASAATASAAPQAGERPEAALDEPEAAASPESALPASAGLSPVGADGAPNPGAFPDPPSSTPATTTQIDDAVRDAPRKPGTEGPGSRGQPASPTAEPRPHPRPGWGPPGARPALRGHHAAAHLTRDGPPARPHPPDRAPRAVPGAPPVRDGGPRGVP